VPRLGQQRHQGAGQHQSNSRHQERGIGFHDLNQVAVEHVDVGRQSCDATPRKPLQHCIFQRSGGILSGNFLGRWIVPLRVEDSSETWLITLLICWSNRE